MANRNPNQLLKDAQAEYGAATTPEAKAAAAAKGERARQLGATDAGAQAVWQSGSNKSSNSNTISSNHSNINRSSSSPSGVKRSNSTSTGNRISATGSSGKEFDYNNQNGSIIVRRPDGTASVVYQNDPNYQNTYKAMQQDTGIEFPAVSYQEAEDIVKKTSPVQNTAQVISPAKNGQNGGLSNYGEGELRYNQDGTYSRFLGGQEYIVKPEDTARYNAIREEYAARNGNTSSVGVESPNYVTEADIQSMIQEAMSNQYTPIDQTQYTDNILSYDEAMDIAQRILEPQFQAKYSQAAATAAQNLERSGIYDSLYGQALAQNAQNAVTQDLQAAAAALANELVGSSREQALSLLELAMQDNQFAAENQQGNLQLGMDYTMRMLDYLLERTNSDRDYDLNLQAQQLKERIANADISATEAQTQATLLDMELAQREMALREQEAARSGRRTSSSGSSGSGGDDNEVLYLGDATGPDDNGTSPNDDGGSGSDNESFIDQLEIMLLTAPSRNQREKILDDAYGRGALTNSQLAYLASKYNVSLV